MNDTAQTKPPIRKPAGPLHYKEIVGANVWPWSGAVDKGLFRVLNGERATFLEDQGGGMVAVIISSGKCVMPKAEWRKLPIWEG